MPESKQKVLFKSEQCTEGIGVIWTSCFSRTGINNLLFNRRYPKQLKGPYVHCIVIKNFSEYLSVLN